MSRVRWKGVAIAMAVISCGACASSPVVTPASPSAVAFAPTEPDSVQLFESDAVIPFDYVAVATITPRRSMAGLSDMDMRPIRELAAQRGADGLVVNRLSGGRVRFSAIHLTKVPHTVARPATGTADPASTAGTGTSTRGGCTGSCDVHVRGYTRKDGTYVRPHTRSSPGRGGGRRH